MEFYIQCPEPGCEWRRGPYPERYWGRRRGLDDLIRWRAHYVEWHAPQPLFETEDA